MIEVGVHLPTTAIGRRIPAPLGMPRDEVLIGRAARGGDVIWRPDDNGRAHLFIAGRTGGGKGVSSNDVLAHATAAGWRIVVLNPKKAGEFRWLGSSASIAETPTGMFKALEWVRLEMERRADILDDVFGVASWTHVPLEKLARHRMDHRVLLFIDEIVRLTTMKGIVAPPGPSSLWCSRPTPCRRPSSPPRPSGPRDRGSATRPSPTAGRNRRSGDGTQRMPHPARSDRCHSDRFDRRSAR